MIQSFDRRSVGRVTDHQDDLRSASIPDCAQWAREYFDQYPNTNVEVIVLYQAALAVDTAKDTTQLTHHFVPVFGPKFAAWRDGGGVSSALQHQFAGRKDRDEPTRLIMTNGATTMPMPAGYMFQRSEIYRYYDPQEGPHNAVILNPAPGVFINAVFGQGSTLLCEPKTLCLVPYDIHGLGACFSIQAAIAAAASP